MKSTEHEESLDGKKEVFVSSITQEYSLFEIDRELDTFLDEIEEEIENRGETSTELLERF
jgi:hypothetical protein